MDRTGRRYTQFKNFKNYSNSVIQNEKLFDAYEKIKNSTRSNNLLKSKTNDIKIDETWVKTIEYYPLLKYSNYYPNTNGHVRIFQAANGLPCPRVCCGPWR